MEMWNGELFLKFYIWPGEGEEDADEEEEDGGAPILQDQEDRGLTPGTLLTTNMAIHSTSTVTNPTPLLPTPVAAQTMLAALPSATTLAPATSSQTKSRDRNLSEASQEASSRSVFVFFNIYPKQKVSVLYTRVLFLRSF